MHPLQEHREYIKHFWSQFGGGKCDGRGYDRQTKLTAVKRIAEVKLWFKHQQSLSDRRAKFDHVKRRRHNRLSHRRCFICEGPAHVRHHLIQLQHGGINSRRNIISLCRPCHADIHPWLKGDQ